MGGNVIVRNKPEKLAEEETVDARKAINALNMEYIPTTIEVNGKTKRVDRARYISEETPTKAGNIVVRATRNLCRFEKERNKRRNQRAHIETIDRKMWEEKHKVDGEYGEKKRLWDEPYKCPHRLMHL